MKIPALAILALVEMAGCDGHSMPSSTAPLDSVPLGADPLGSVIVADLTTGGAFDVDGYSALVDEQVFPLDANDERAVANLPAGPHTVELRDLASNCSASGGLARIAQVLPGRATRVAFEIRCSAPPELSGFRLVFFSVGANGGIEAMNADGTGRLMLAGGRKTGPDPSPDGTEIAFARVDAGSHALMVMDADGTHGRVVADGDLYAPDWSPDARSIAAVAGGDVYGGSIQVIPPGGGPPRFLTGPLPVPHDWGPRWSPDGARVTFSRYDGDANDVWVMDADGAHSQPLSKEGGSGAVWSSDGRRLAYRRDTPPPGTVIVAMNADGSEPRTLLVEGSLTLIPSDWSKDGSLMLLNGYRGKGESRRADVYLARLEDGTVWRVTADAEDEYDPKFMQTTTSLRAHRQRGSPQP